MSVTLGMILTLVEETTETQLSGLLELLPEVKGVQE